MRDRWGAGTSYRYLGLTKMPQGDLLATRSLLQKSLDTFTNHRITFWIKQLYMLRVRLTIDHVSTDPHDPILEFGWQLVKVSWGWP